LKGRILASNWPFTMGKLAKVILKSSSSSPFNGYSNTYSERMHFFELFAIFNVFCNLYCTSFARAGRKTLKTKQI
jgi:hypothetical protein